MLNSVTFKTPHSHPQNPHFHSTMNSRLTCILNRGGGEDQGSNSASTNHSLSQAIPHKPYPALVGPGREDGSSRGVLPSHHRPPPTMAVRLLVDSGSFPPNRLSSSSCPKHTKQSQNGIRTPLHDQRRASRKSEAAEGPCYRRWVFGHLFGDSYTAAPAEC